MSELGSKLDAEQEFEVRFVESSVLRPLRHEVLRQGHPFESTIFEGDDEPNSSHAALYDKRGEVVGIGSLVDRAFKDKPGDRAFQLRGMAVADSIRGTGAGKLVLSALEGAAHKAGATLVWCHARTAAVGFYKRAGWQIVSDEYEIPTVGPHYTMTKVLHKTC